MTMTLSDSLGTAAISPTAGTSEPHSEGLVSPEGASFGQLMSDLLQLQTEKTDPDLALASSTPGIADGQQLADAWGLGAEIAAPGLVCPLKEMTLGPHLNVITPETAAPDPQSLEAFARAQGLDEKAVQWLFGKLATTPATSATTVTVTPTAAASDTPVVLSATVPAALTAAATAGALLPPLAPLAPLTTRHAATADHANTAPTAALQATAQALLALGAMAEGAGADKKTSPSSTDSTADGLPIQLLRMPPPAAVWMQRSLMNGVLQETATAPKGPDISESELDLGEEWSPDLLNSLLSKTGDNAPATHTTGTQGAAYANFAARWDAQAAARTDPGAAALTDLSSAAARSENIQNLANKMGQAIGQRILSEMEKGQWHLKLQLRPATLGHIEVEMRMRSGEFDAVFTAPNATTRDLLQDGMGKLKETLAQMGMDVASVHVGNGQSGQSGGHPTPRSPQHAPAATGPNSRETAAVTNTRAPHVKTPQEGLDVMV